MQLTSALEFTLRQVVDLVFPQTCVHCNTEGRLLCDTCLRDAARIGSSACRTCGIQLEHGSRCGKCSESPPAVTRVTAVFQFEGAIRGRCPRPQVPRPPGHRANPRRRVGGDRALPAQKHRRDRARAVAPPQTAVPRLQPSRTPGPASGGANRGPHFSGHAYPGDGQSTAGSSQE